MPIVNYLYTIAISGYWEKEQWQAWADELIIRHNELEDWIYEISTAENWEEVDKALADEKVDEVFDENTYFWTGDVVIGYYYLMYQEGRMSLLELFDRLTNEDDISNDNTVLEYEEVEHIYDEMRMGMVDFERIDGLLEPLTKRAKKQLEAIMSYMKV